MTPTRERVPQAIGRIEIVMFENSHIQTSLAVPNRQTFNAMMETAKQDGLARLLEAERKPKVVMPEIDASRLSL